MGEIILIAVLLGVLAAWGPKAMLGVVLAPFVVLFMLLVYESLPERSRPVSDQCYRSSVPGKVWCAER